MTREDRFWNKVARGAPDECWEWQGARYTNGYGMAWVGGTKQTMLAHRVAYVIAIGEIPDGMCVCHRCDTPLCVNPKHLFIGTNYDNVRDMIGKGRQNGQMKTHCSNGHPLSGDNLKLEGPLRRRRCLACQKKRDRIRYLARKQVRPDGKLMGSGAAPAAS